MQTYSDADVFTTGGLLTAKALGISNTSNTSGTGLSLYGGPSLGQPTYGMMFSGTGTFGTYGTVTGDWATYFTMNNTANRGWIFKTSTGTGGNVASINTAGAASFAGNLTVGTGSSTWSMDGSTSTYKIKSGTTDVVTANTTDLKHMGKDVAKISNWYPATGELILV